MQLAILIDEIFKQRLTESEHRRPFVLGVALHRVDHFARIGERYVAQNFHFAGFGIDFDFRGAEDRFPKTATGNPSGTLSSLAAS